MTPTATWWPSTLYQTTTLELRRDGERLLVDPGIPPWEIDEAVPALDRTRSRRSVTHADWYHAMALGALPEAQVTASPGAAERIRSGEAREVDREGVGPGLRGCTWRRARCTGEQEVDPPADAALGPLERRLSGRAAATPPTASSRGSPTSAFLVIG